MSAKSDFLEQKLIDHVYNQVSYAATVTTYVALFTAAPGETGGGTEVSGGAYARVLVNPNSGIAPKWNLAVADGGSGGYLVDNANDITFPTATANWGTVTHVATKDAAAAGNFLHYGALTASKTVNTDDIFKFAAGALDIIET